MHRERRNVSPKLLADKAKMIRRETVKLTDICGSGHYGSAFSMAELIASLYYELVAPVVTWVRSGGGVVILLVLEATLSVAQISQAGRDVIFGMLILVMVIIYGRQQRVIA